MKRKEIFFGGIIVAAFVIITVTFYGYQITQTANFQINKSDKFLFIPEKADFKTVLDILKSEQMVQDVVSFAFMSKLMNYQKNVKPGRYLVKRNMNNLAMIRMLRAGLQEPTRLTFNNLRLLDDFTEKVSEAMDFEKEELDSLLLNPKFTAKYGFDTTNILSLFLPNTYQFYWNTSAEKFVEKMHKEYKKFWNEKRLNQAKALKFSPQQVSVLASIVQAETSKNTEKPRIAGVYLNRLREKMKLQADPTLVYALGDFSIKRVLDVHKAIDSPYNTYKYEGLPPGPINMPDIQTIDAVLNYEKHDYLYFCAKEDFSGFHNFAVNYAQHLKNAKLYQKALNMRGIK